MKKALVIATASGAKHLISTALLSMVYGTIYTELDAFKELFHFDAKVIISGRIKGSEGPVTFAVEERVADIKAAVFFLKRYNYE